MKFLSNLVELIAVIVVVPLVLLFRFLVVALVLAFLASPLIAFVWAVWLVAK